MALKTKLFKADKGIDQVKVVYAKSFIFKSADGETDHSGQAAKLERLGLVWKTKPADATALPVDETATSEADSVTDGDASDSEAEGAKTN